MKGIGQDREMIEVHARLLQLNDFQKHLEWIQESREEQRNLNEKANGNDLYRGSGKALNMTELLDAVESAPEALERIKREGNSQDTLLTAQL